MKVVRPKINFMRALRSMSVIYTAILPVRRTVVFLTCLLSDERRRRGTHAGTRALSPVKQAALVLRWFLGLHSCSAAGSHRQRDRPLHRL